MFDYEFADLQHHVNCRLANRVLVPDAIPARRLARFGARGGKLVRYPGLKEEYYLQGFAPDEGLPGRLGAEPGAPLAVVRTPPAYALYLGGAESALLPRVLERLSGQGAQTVVLPRTPEQADAIAALGLGGVHVARRAVDGRSLVALADLLVSAGGTMNREAAVLGTPVWSMFEGRLGAVDEMLVHQGRLRLLRDPDEIVVARKDRAAAPALRDPAELLRLALPWVT
jgi:predicted glycosyltransferase